MSEPWGGSGVPGLPGTAASAQRALCPSGREWSRSGPAPSCFMPSSKLSPPPDLQAAWLGKSVVGVWWASLARPGPAPGDAAPEAGSLLPVRLSFAPAAPGLSSFHLCCLYPTTMGK